MNRVWIGIAAVVVVAAAGLYVLLDAGSEAPVKTEPPEVKNDQPPATDPSSPTPERPALPERPDVTAGKTTSTDYVEVINDAGVRIRDKRGRVVNTDYEAPVRRPFKSLDMDPKMLDKMGRALRGVARECKRAHPGDLAAGARIQPRVTFEIKADQLNITAAQVSLTNVKEGGEFQRCFHSGAIGLSVAAAGHREVDRHKMLVPIDLDDL